MKTAMLCGMKIFQFSSCKLSGKSINSGHSPGKSSVFNAILHTGKNMPTPLPTPAEMALWDHLTSTDFGLSGEMLMENASRAALAVLKDHFGSLDGKSVLVFAGPGKNGGDAFALARHLTDSGARVHVLHTKQVSQYTDESAFHLRLVKRLGIACFPLSGQDVSDFPPADIVVDGLLGTGLRDSLRPELHALVETVNTLGKGAFIFSLDIPSGLSGLTGLPMPVAVRADLTVTFEAAKLGLFLPGAHAYIGKLVVVPIGIPEYIKIQNPVLHVGLDASLADSLSAPQADMHKNRGGHVLILGGSPGMTGAPLLAARAAFRAGAGLITIACPQALTATYAAFPEYMTLALGRGETWTRECFAALSEHLPRFASVVLGPGMGRAPGGLEFLRAYLTSPHPRTLYDADALFHLAQSPELLGGLGLDALLTPHPGELGAFFGLSGAQINLDRLKYARQFAQEQQVNVVLKGAGSLVAGPLDPVAISPFSAPNLAIAGSGDMLSGLVGALMGRGLATLTAAQIGVYWHGYAGVALARDFPWRGNTPLEIADILPTVLKEWKQCVQPPIS